jgi:hypothetical protein
MIAALPCGTSLCPQLVGRLIKFLPVLSAVFMDLYKARLTAWLDNELVKYDSYNRIASRMVIASNSDVNDESIRRWHKQIYTRSLGDEMLGKIAAYRDWPLEKVRGWLNGSIEFEDLAGTIPKSEEPGKGARLSDEEILQWLDDCEDPVKLARFGAKANQRIGQLLESIKSVTE